MKHGSMVAPGGLRKIGAIVVLVSCLAATACKSTSSGDASSSTTTTQAPGTVTVDDRAPGVTDDTIKVGVPYLDLSDLKDVLNIDNGDFKTAFESIADDINDKGGINGRKLEMVFTPVSPAQPAGTAAACTKFTQDEKVFVVLGFMFADDVLCYVDTNSTPAIGGEQTTERLGKANVPWYSTDGSEDAEPAIAEALMEGGKLDGKVAVVGNASDQAMYDNRIKPILEDGDVDVVDTAFLSAPVSDTNALSAESQTVVERFKASGADQVLVIGGSAPATFVGALAETDYRPLLRITNTGPLSAYIKGEGNDLSLLEGSASGGGFDAGANFQELGGLTQECLKIQEDAGLVVKPSTEVPQGEPNQVAATLEACQKMYLLKAILEKAGPELNFGTYQTAGDSLGEIELPFSPDPWFFGAPPHADGDPKLYVYDWDAESETYKQA